VDNFNANLDRHDSSANILRIVRMIKLLQRDGGGGFGGWNIGVGTKAHKKVKVRLKSNINVTKKY
jgi:hypothetical protein